VVGVLAVLVVAQAAALTMVALQLTAANRKIDRLAASDDRQLGDLAGRTRTLEQQAARTLDASAVAQAVLPSVFKIIVPDGLATTFAVGTTTNGTDLLTNYHVVESMWNRGERTAVIEHDNQRFPVQVVRVDPEFDLALLHANQKFPRIAVSTATVTPGTPIVVIGAPRGFEQSVSSGVVSALRTDVPESAGKTFIQYDAASNPGNSGGPLVNAQKQVIGIVRGNLNGPGLNYAIPISVACRSFDGIC
jgi:S1-C subfamily serine protease